MNLQFASLKPLQTKIISFYEKKAKFKYNRLVMPLILKVV